MLKRLLPAFALVTVAACTESGNKWENLGRLQSEIAIIPRGSTCDQLGLGKQSFTIANPVSGDYALDSTNTLHFQYYDDTSTIFYFNQSTMKITGVLASIGDRTLVWDIGVPGADAWPSLHGPIDAETGELDPPEEVTFCYDYELYVQPSPFANYQNRNTWTITKTGPADRLTLSQGQEELVEYEITVTHNDSAADGQFIEGPFFVNNLSPFTATVSELAVDVGGIAGTVTCPIALPFTVAPGATVVCEFRADVPDTTDRNVVGTATVSHGLRVSTREVVASFSSPTTGQVEVDNCVKVTDDAVPYTDHFLGTVCAEEGSATFSFSYQIGPFTQCGNFSVTTTASYEGLDTGATADAPWTTLGTVQCNASCTLGQHYWKMHSHYGPRRYNPTWDGIGSAGENTTFFQSGKTYIEAFYTRPMGNSYWVLAKAYMAARLNQLNGATFTPNTLAAFNQATTLFSTYTPYQIACNHSLRKTFAKLASVLKDFNNGKTGPGKCTGKPDLDNED